jgi:uncharacterized oxidoreductase
MKIVGNTILITGGATGIGFALADALVKAGNKVIICGRRQGKLTEAKNRVPELEIKACDITDEKERASLLEWVKSNFADLNILINNAGVQRVMHLKEGIKDLQGGEDEIQTNLVALVRLSAYFVPFLLEKKESAIINVSSGLAFKPLAAKPVYSATKAAVHSFTVSLRQQLKDTPVKVFEIIPPTVATELLKTTAPGINSPKAIAPAEVAAAVLPALANDQYEIPVGEAHDKIKGSRSDY